MTWKQAFRSLGRWTAPISWSAAGREDEIPSDEGARQATSSSRSRGDVEENGLALHRRLQDPQGRNVRLSIDQADRLLDQSNPTGEICRGFFRRAVRQVDAALVHTETHLRLFYQAR